MTWAYPQDTNIEWLEQLYDGKQGIMYQSIVSAVTEKIVPDKEFSYMMPSGTAIQNANATLTDDDLYRDNQHLSDFGGLIASYTWYCVLENKTLEDIQLTTIPATLRRLSADRTTDLTINSNQISVLVKAVNDAIENYASTTDTSVYED